MACKGGQFKNFSTNSNAQHVSGMTHFDLAMYVRLLDTLGSRELYCEIAQF